MLNNKVSFYKIPGVRSVAISARVKAGSWFEKDKDWGLAHLVEHMFFQGTEKFPTKEKFDDYIEKNGIYCNAWTSGPAIHIFIKGPDEKYEECKILLNELLTNVYFSENKLENEKKVIEREYADKWSKPENRFDREISKQLFGDGHQYIRDGVGVIEYVSNASRQSLKSYYGNFVNSSNSCVGISGNVDDSENIGLNEQYDLKWNIEDIHPGERSMTHYEEGLKSATLVLTNFVKGMYDSDRKYRSIFSLISYTLGGSMRSILFKKIRDELGLAYSVNSQSTFLPTVGLFQITTKIPEEKIDSVISEIKKELADYKNTLTDDVFDKAKTYQKWQRVMAFDTPSNVAERLSNQLLWEGKTYSLDEELKLLESITKNELLEVYNNAFKEADPFISIMRTK